MYLIQCKCGCHFTLKTLAENKPLHCQNCEKGVVFTAMDGYSAAMSKLESAGFTVSRIPKNAKITVTFQTESQP